MSPDDVPAELIVPNPLVDPTDRPAVEAMLGRLAGEELRLVGQLVEASNGVFLGVLGGDEPVRVIYKPTRGERPLHDFPPATLAQRETAAFLVSHEGGYAVVPPTVLREGPLGPGSVQLWIDHDEAAAPMVDLVAPDAIEEGVIPVFTGETPTGEQVVVVHRDTEAAARFAAYDCVVNNADRKGSHVLVDPTGREWGIDHGITLHAEPKLRTVLWGWVGDPLPAAEVARLALLESLLGDPGSALVRGLLGLLSSDEIEALAARVSALLAAGTYPEPDPGHYPIPWPPL
ncbi:SCO1664 family protein [Arsenicicoccus bolidensis]|uniref:SCO1664 family protein n=1 Tax=Arsenicicoccus bolidensis TaxID=229480 RepID=UPI0028AA41C8|nr:SCO1664 family protein [Arsenicicoccus bolidensis]